MNEQRLASFTVELDNRIHDVIKAHMTWLSAYKINYPDFVAYYNKHGLHNLNHVLRH